MKNSIKFINHTNIIQYCFKMNKRASSGLFDGIFDDYRGAPSKSFVKIALIGDGATGKTSFFNRIANGDNSDYKFNKIYDATRGCNICQIEYMIGKHTITIHLFDTAGQELYGALRDSYIMGVDGIIIMYDLSEKITKQNVTAKWIPEVKHMLSCTKTHSYIPIAVVGNKNDKLETSNYFPDPSILTHTNFENLHDNYRLGSIEEFSVSVKADKDLMKPINWLLKNILSYYMPINVKRTKKQPVIVMTNT
jgi:GTP-binding nuclear protein Ran